MQDIVVTATKKAGGVSVFKAPLAITALGERQLSEAHTSDLQQVTNLVPNVYLNGANTTPRTAAFSIRGLALYGSVPSSTPAVGVFQDGVYLGVNQGTVLDVFDLEGIEVLRGPQGLLFGRNVTAGAVLLRTTAPSDHFTADARVSVDAGLNGNGANFTTSGLVSGPLNESGTLKAKISVYADDDTGYFRNLYNGNNHLGKNTTTLGRAAFTYDSHEALTNTLRLEHGSSTGDGSIGQNHGLFSRNSFDVSIDTEGFSNLRWNMVVNQTDLKVGLGEGVITNIAGYRDLYNRALSDVDSTPTFGVYNFGNQTKQHQLSDELRYSGDFGPVSATVGAFYYTDKLLYVENRVVSAGAGNVTGGGQQTSSQYAIFSAFDVSLPAGFKLNLGARYSSEHKHAQVQRILPTGASNPCSFVTNTCTSYPFDGARSWSFFTPKVGLEWEPGSHTHLYTYWTRANRSGGYNLRQTSPTSVSNPSVPGPYDQETETTYEVGLKQSTADRRLTFNLAAFINKFKNLQKDVLTNDPVLGTLQVTANSADVTIKGIEGEVNFIAIEGLTLGANFGYLHSHFDRILYDLSGNGSIGPEDYALQLPYLSPWSYGVSASYDHATDWGSVSGRVAFNHRDTSFSNDNNVGVLNPTNNLDANLAVSSIGRRVTFSIYGKNLLNKTVFGLDTPLPFFPKSTFSPLNKGRVLGMMLEYHY